ncbi:aldo/keto reductase [Paraburkholderia strydomiana]
MKCLETKGLTIPCLGLGTFRMTGEECRIAVESALELGYRHIDTAEMYGNEKEVGAALASSGVVRSEVHVTSKVWHENLTPERMHLSIERTLQSLQIDELDLYMVHWPSPAMDLPVVMKTMMSFLDAGLTRAIGVCNFPLGLLKTTIDTIGAPIACHQIEYHPFLQQRAMLDYLREKGVPLVAYAPLAQGRAASDPVLEAIGRKYGATAAQVAIAWTVDQDGVIAIPKAKGRASQMSNLAALELRLDDDDRHAISTLPKNLRYVSPPFAPDWSA